MTLLIKWRLVLLLLLLLLQQVLNFLNFTCISCSWHPAMHACSLMLWSKQLLYLHQQRLLHFMLILIRLLLRLLLLCTFCCFSGVLLHCIVCCSVQLTPRCTL